jgi:hypothetical protein
MLGVSSLLGSAIANISRVPSCPPVTFILLILQKLILHTRIVSTAKFYFVRGKYNFLRDCTKKRYISIARNVKNSK